VAAMQAIVVVTTVGTEEQANLIAREIVARRQAACVNVVPGIRSTYRWKGKICKDGELLLIIKTLEGEFEGVATTIRELHSYELPEILSFSVSQGEQRFLEWIAGSVDKQAAFGDDEEEEEIAFADSDED
jgi:periplasmic divalent cation tolerance protein